jgi:3-hydroxyisobutyrate dehydrogenase
MLARDFDKPNFPAIHLLKDLDLFLAEAEEKGLGTDGVAGVRQVVAAAVGMGHAESDYSAVYEAVDPPDAE